jgi:protein-tyrosine phosphatase
MIRAKILLAICGLFFLLNCGDGDSNSSLPQMRVISVDGASNFRDFGGYPTASGKTVRWRQLYRSSKLSGLTDMGLETFESLGIRMVIDLRTQEEIDEAPDLLPQGVDWQNITLKESSIGDALKQALKTGDTSGLEFDKIVQSYADFYITNVEEYGELLPLVMSSDNRPIDIHCAGGASRTGFTVALIQFTLGVTEFWVMDDFLLTNEVTALDIQDTVELFRETIIANTGQEPTEEDMENLTNVATMHSEYLQAALDRVVEEYGSVDNFIRDGIGITDEQRSAFRAALL